MITHDDKLLKNNPYSFLTAFVVDNHNSMQSIIKSMLIKMGFKRVITAPNGKDALHRLGFNKVDIIISDWEMPKMNGLELLQAIRKGENTANVPFIMLTANVDPNDVKKAISSGVSQYLLKPFNSNSIKEKVSRAFLSPIPKKTLSNTSSTVAAEVEASTEITKATNSILIVDDEPNNITLLTELLKGKYTLQACLSGAKALEICKKEELPDLILLDIMMPNMDGLEVCKALKENPLTEHIPIIFITALSQTKDVVKGLSIGAVDYITKPITPEITLARISIHMKEVLQRAEMASQLDIMIENMRLKEDIERIIHHDLKQPLAAITSASETLKEQQKYSKQQVNLIAQSVFTIQQKIDEQMVVLQLEDSSINHDLLSVNALELFNKIVYRQTEKCKQHNVLVHYKIAKDLHFLGNQLLCFHMFTNLLVNAIEASPSGGEVNILLDKNEDSLLFKINNQGVIPETIQTRFFDKFITSGKDNGTGLGTYLAKLAALTQEGDIKFSSTEENGTTLTVTLKVVP